MRIIVELSSGVMEPIGAAVGQRSFFVESGLTCRVSGSVPPRRPSSPADRAEAPRAPVGPGLPTCDSDHIRHRKTLLAVSIGDWGTLMRKLLGTCPFGSNLCQWAWSRFRPDLRASSRVRFRLQTAENVRFARPASKRAIRRLGLNKHKLDTRKHAARGDRCESWPS